MSCLETQVCSVLQTLVKAAVVELVRVMDESVCFKEKQTLITAAWFEAQLNTVLETQVKEAVAKICRVFNETSAVLHLCSSPHQIAQDDLKRKLKPVSRMQQGDHDDIPSGHQKEKAHGERIPNDSYKWTEEKGNSILQPESHIPSVTTSEQSTTMESFMDIEEPSPEHVFDNENISVGEEVVVTSEIESVGTNITLPKVKETKQRKTKTKRDQKRPLKEKACGESSNTPKERNKLHSVKKRKLRSCDMCGKSFSHSNLNRHLRIHTGEKPFICRTCGSSFNQLNTLKAHERIHTGEKPYVCKSCGKSFSQASSLKLHDGRHTGQIGFSCVVCGLASVCVTALKNHHMTHVGETSMSCRVCGAHV